jgi:DNA-binding GntR family transcriptional regulator
MKIKTKKASRASAIGHHGSRATEAYLRLRDLIVEGSLMPGARLIEAELADGLEISRTPVRAALQRLRDEGFVEELDRGRRARLLVAPLTLEGGSELYLLLGEIDGLAAYYAAGLPDKVRGSVADELQATNDRLKEMAQHGSMEGERYFQLDADFHEHYWNAAEHPRVSGILDFVKPQAERYIRVYTRAWISEISRSVRDHQQIVAAIRSGDRREAQEAARTNYRNATARLAEGFNDMATWRNG